MINTYNFYKKFADLKYLSMSNTELVDKYTTGSDEYTKSQSFGALFIKNFPAIVKITSRYYNIESSEKAEMVIEELLKSLKDYNSDKSKFITYFINRLNNLFLWNCTNNKNKNNFFSEMINLDDYTEEDEYKLQVADSKCDNNIKVTELRIDIEKAFEMELTKYKNTKEYEKNKKRIEFNKAVLNILSEDPSQCASQIARRLGLVRPKEEYYECRLHPDYDIIEELDGSGKKVKRVVVNTLVRTAQYEKVQRAIKEIRKLLLNYNICA